MRNYIILNDQISTNIKGLLIQALPPISKPKQRVEVEEIDGRDGDIVTYLGYGAYDKEIEIGLYGDFNIDEIIAYFNSQGTVTFSNEDDKYYNYKIVEQIDFERLVRYRTATVKMHCQPFKYSINDNEKTFNINNNLLNFSNYSKNANGITVTYLNGSLTVSGTSTSDAEIYLPITELTLDSGTYTLSALANGTNPNKCIVNIVNSNNTSSFTEITLANNTTKTSSATLTESETYNSIYFSIENGSTVNFTLNLQLINNNSSGSISIRNAGNYYSRPSITITGSGTINLYLNNVQIFVIDLSNYTSITIDATQMEAYNGSTLLNRNVTGNYDNLHLNVGNNTISWSGTITQIQIENYSRWL